MTNAIAKVVNGFIDLIVIILDFLVGWLPDSPFLAPIEAMRSSFGLELFGYLNFFLPISEFLVVLNVWVDAIVIYYGVSIVLRWAKTVS